MLLRRDKREKERREDQKSGGDSSRIPCVPLGFYPRALLRKRPTFSRSTISADLFNIRNTLSTSAPLFQFAFNW